MSAMQHGSCDYCGLPLPRPLWGGDRRGDPSTPAYCCFGCRFAASVTGEKGDDGAARWTLTRLGLAIFLTMNVMVCTFVLWSYDVYDGARGTAMSAALAELLRSLSLLLALPVLLLLGRPIVASALAELRRGVMSSDLLVMAGVAAAYAYSITSILRGSGTTYFEVGCMVLVFITLGRWIEATGKLRATNALDELQRLLPERVTKLTSAGTVELPIADVRIGDVLIVRPHERFPTDGVLVSGETSVDQQIVTGESWPVTMQTGDAVTGGALNLESLVQIRVTALPSEGTLGRLVDAVRLAREAKGRYQKLADQVAGWFLLVVTAIAVAALVWHGQRSGWGHGLMTALAVLLIACPCALGLATPLAVWTALGRAARRGVVFRSGDALERLAQVRSLRFDKTGTLTTGQPRLLRVHSDGVTEPDLIRRHAEHLASVSRHAFCRAIRADEAARDNTTVGNNGWAGVEAHELPGLGVVRRLDEQSASADGGCGVGGETIRVALGSERLMTQEGFALPERLRARLDQDQTAGHPVVAIGWEGRVRGLYVFAESLRPHAAEVVSMCRGLGLDVAVLTGDHEARGRQIADELSVRVEAGLLPEQKIQCVRAARHFGPVAMVGDGINDAPALAAADVGIAMGCGTDLARDTAEVCLVGDDLRQLPWIIALSRRTVRTIRQNLAWAFGYNSVGVLVAASGRLHPALAAALMLASSLIVISNSLRLNRDDEDLDTSGGGLPKDGAAQLPRVLPRSVAEVTR
jgi:heavy metal translocating P-type ATPase